MLCSAVTAQQALTVTDCMRYAVAHNHDIRISQLTQDNRRAERLAAIGSMLPSLSGNIGAQYNFGRAIDPETNTYTNVSTFYNGYSVTASLPLFDGFQNINRLRAARAGVLMGNSELQAKRDELCLQVFEAYCNVLYYQGTVRMAGEKLEQSRQSLRQTRLMCEVGRKSEADIAQMEAQLAADEYEVTRQSNELVTARLALAQLMNWQGEIETAEDLDTLRFQDSSFRFQEVQKNKSFFIIITGNTGKRSSEETTHDGEAADWADTDDHPMIEAARQSVSQARSNLRVARGGLSPSLSVSAGVNTTYNKVLHSEATGYGEQLNNNRGEYVYASLTIPLFNRLQTLTNIRRQRNNLRIAEEELAQKQDELTKLRLRAASDWEGYRRQTVQMERKVEADSLAYRLTARKYEEGLASSIDVQTTSATLLQSRAQLLQCRLMTALKERMTRYYSGERICDTE